MLKSSVATSAISSVAMRADEYASMNAQMARPNPIALNLAARQAIVSQAIRKTQRIFSTSGINLANQNVFVVNPRNAGLIIGFWVELTMTITNVDADAGDLTLSAIGAANVLQRIQFQDLSNNTRIDTTGWHLHFVNTAKNNAPFLAARTNSGYPVNYGNNFTDLMQATTPIAQNGGTGTVRVMYFVPLAYNSQDLRGSVYGNVLNATMNLTLTVTPRAQFFALAATNAAVTSVYTGAADAIDDATVTNLAVNVYQVYWDQLPMTKDGVLLPLLDVSTIYELKNTALTGLTVGQDFPIPYSNFRDFLSTFAIYDNGGTLNVGSDINNWKLQAANFTNIFEVTPKYVSAWARQCIRDDFPQGTYYFNTRERPISTIQFGNMELLVNPSVVNANARLLVGFEDFGLIGAIPGAGSLAVSG
jgi:hypothetical protein